jgi:hypothetical protein
LIQCVLGALYNERGLLKFYHSPHPTGKELADENLLSTTEEGNREKYESFGIPFKPMYVASITPQGLLSQLPGPYDFVSIDTEGTSVDLWLDLFQRNLGALAWCVEHDGRHHEIESVAMQSDFETCFFMTMTLSSWTTLCICEVYLMPNQIFHSLLSLGMVGLRENVLESRSRCGR